MRLVSEVKVRPLAKDGSPVGRPSLILRRPTDGFALVELFAAPGRDLLDAALELQRLEAFAAPIIEALDVFDPDADETTEFPKVGDIGFHTADNAEPGFVGLYKVDTDCSFLAVNMENRGDGQGSDVQRAERIAFHIMATLATTPEPARAPGL